MSTPAPLLVECPQCKGMHFNVAADGQLICTSHFHGAIGCGWRGSVAGITATANHPLNLLMAKLPDFDLGWTPEQKLSWFDGMAKLLQAAS